MRNFDEFVKYYELLKEWFLKEELNLPETVLGRMAARFQEVVAQQRSQVLDQVLEEAKPYLFWDERQEEPAIDLSDLETIIERLKHE